MSDIHVVELGGTFRVAWVSSGATASTIQFQVRNGSEQLVSTYTGVDSLNGFYYADVVINSPGLWKGEWYAYVNPNTYRNTEYFQAFAGDTDQPGRYITYDDVVIRYPTFASIGDAVLAASHYISYAEAEVDARLGAAFSPPFDRSNLTVRDLAVDISYLRSIRGKTEEYDALKKSIDERIAALNAGTMVMIASGAVLDPPSGAWSNTQNYHPIFTAALPIEDMVVDSMQLIDEATERGYTLG